MAALFVGSVADIGCKCLRLLLLGGMSQAGMRLHASRFAEMSLMMGMHHALEQWALARPRLRDAWKRHWNWSLGGHRVKPATGDKVFA